MRIQYFFDVISPYTAFSTHFLHRYKSIWNYELVYSPVLLGGVMKLAKNVPPGANALKFDYMLHELSPNMLCKQFDYPMLNFPNNFFEAAKNVKVYQRAILAVQELESDKLEEVVNTLTSAVFQNSKFRNENNNLILNETTLLSALNSTSLDGKSISEIMNLVNSELVKKKLIENTSLAVKKGMFGAPTMLISDEKIQAKPLFIFGSDRFELVAKIFDKPYFGTNPIQKEL
eukprot:snap_masked-scaffold_51-processed-gene-1.1-mRNA-1 protein AED:0.94 eAED:1.00 QI:0/-1/0/1/-1/1/1/0/230